MREARTRRPLFGLLLSALVVGSLSQLNAEMLFFANGRTVSVKDYRISGDSVTVTLRNGGEAIFQKSLIARIAPDEVPAAAEVTSVRTETADSRSPSLVSATAERRPYADLIHTVSLRHGIDPDLVHAVVQTESNYQPKAKSAMGAQGLMQVMPTTAADFGVRNLYDPRANLEAGVQYLKFLLTRFDLTRAIAAYNAGPAAVRKYRGVPPFPETQNYVKRVLANFRQ